MSAFISLVSLLWPFTRAISEYSPIISNQSTKVPAKSLPNFLAVEPTLESLCLTLTLSGSHTSSGTLLFPFLSDNYCLGMSRVAQLFLQLGGED